MPAWLSKAVMPVLIGLGLLSLTAFLALQAVNGVNDWLETYRNRIIAGNDDHWKAEIAAANLLTARTQAAQMQQAIGLEADAQKTMASAQALWAQAEKKNAELPNPDACGLSHARRQLLPK
jgi:hypothetical protein